MVLTDRTDDNEENLYNDNKKLMMIEDTWYMMTLDGQNIYGAAWPKSQNVWGLHYFTGYWSVREVKFHEQGSKCDNKGWMIIWSYHFILFPLHHTWSIFTWMEHFIWSCFRIYVVDYLIL